MITTKLCKYILVILSSVFISACSVRQAPQAEVQNAINTHISDPFEGVNRAIFKFNNKADKYLIKPVAKTYYKVVPKPVRQGTYNFFSNLQEPRNILNSLLQGKFDRAGISSGRLAINSSVGLLGLVDVASKLDISKHNEDFGQTMAIWKVPKGPYLVLPLFGPRSLRHAGGMIPDSFANPASYIDRDLRLRLNALATIDGRSRFLDANEILELQLDPYVFLRESYLQKREADIRDNAAPDRAENELDEFDEFDDEGYDDDDI